MSRKEWTLEVDNDAAYLVYVGDPPASVIEDDDKYAVDKWLDEKSNDARTRLFHCDEPVDPVELLKLLGIPAESV